MKLDGLDFSRCRWESRANVGRAEPATLDSIDEGREMKRVRPFLAALACVSAIAATTVAVANADPSNFGTTTWTFTNCTGPAGTPTTFDAARQEFTTPPQSGGFVTGMPAVFLLAGGAEVFQVYMVTNLDTGATGTANGFDHNGLLLVTCVTTSPVTGTNYQFTGFLTGIGPH